MFAGQGELLEEKAAMHIVNHRGLDQHGTAFNPNLAFDIVHYIM